MSSAVTGGPTIPPVTVIVGGEEFLVARTVQRMVGAVRGADPQATVDDVDGLAFDDNHLLALSSPSMFGGSQVLVIRGVQDLSDAYRDALLAYTADPLPDLVVLAVHTGGNKARGLPDELGAAGAQVVRCVAPTRPAERLEFIQDEIRDAGGQATAGAIRMLASAVGNDLRELSAAARQLVADAPGLLDEDAVARFHRGRAETSGFAVADAAIGGQTAEALALLRAALDTGTAPVLVTSALASGLRDVVRVRGASGRSAGAVAKELGMPPWKVDKTLRVARGWADDGLAHAVGAVATADAGVKGAAEDARYTVQRAVLAVLSARGAGSARAETRR